MNMYEFTFQDYVDKRNNLYAMAQQQFRQSAVDKIPCGRSSRQSLSSQYTNPQGNTPAIAHGDNRDINIGHSLTHQEEVFFLGERFREAYQEFYKRLNL